MNTQRAQQVTSLATPIESIGANNALALTITSVVLLQMAIQNGSPRPWIEWTDLIVTLMLTAVAYWVLRRQKKHEKTDQLLESKKGAFDKSVQEQLTAHSLTSLGSSVFLLVFACLPFVSDVIYRQHLAHGNPLEIQLAMAIRNLMLGLCVLPQKYTYRLAIVTSLFLAIYGALVTVSVATNVLLATYALLGLWWLMGNHWQRISAHFPDESTTEIPYSARVGAVSLVLTCLAGGALAFQSSAVTSAVAGFLPGSGGTGGSDPFARGGVGDGEQMVGATDDASSFGPIESELFLESKQPTLYDMFIENYEPAIPRKRDSRSRAIPLTAQETQKQNHSRLAQNKKSTREFNVIRRDSSERKKQKLGNVESKAMLYVAGQTPVHLGLRVFDHWDGQELSLQGEMPEPKLHLDYDDESRRWGSWKHATYGDCFAQPERHQLKIINLKSATVPAPPNLTAVHIDRLHDASFFRWEDGLLRLRGDRIPSLTTVHLRSRPLRFDRLELVSLKGVDNSAKEICDSTTGAGVSTRLNRLAAKWTVGAKTDWQRVERICKQLRQLDHDSDATIPQETTDAVEFFLFESQRGPDYMFATSAAILLKSLGYQSRIVSGLYADPANYDRLAKSTGVFANDIHFWAEVQTDEGHWICVEPTPGYHVRYAQPTFVQEALAAIGGMVDHILVHPLIYLFTTAMLISGVLCRSKLYAWRALVLWKLRLNSEPRKQILRSVFLLQQLTYGRNHARKSGQTLDQWIANLAETASDSTAISEFRSLVAWACYASSDHPALAPTAVRQICIDSIKLLKERV